MKSARRDERGFTVTELMMACALFLVIAGATLTAFTAFTTGHRRTEVQHDHSEDARVALDVAARQLRNLANPTTTATTTINRADDYDFIFQTSDPAKTWVRYCLDTSAPASVNRARLWEAESATAALAAGMGTACPGTGWARARVVSSGISNRVGGIDRNVFEYECAPGWPASCPAAAAEYPRITNVGIELYVDDNTADSIKELRVSTAVYLRNQNEPPTARASWTRTAPKGVLLNASGSTDPEGRTLKYFWFKGTAPTSANFPDCNSSPTGAAGEGLTFSAQLSEAVGADVPFWLVVRDPGCLTSTTPIPVKVPA